VGFEATAVASVYGVGQGEGISGLLYFWKPEPGVFGTVTSTGVGEIEACGTAVEEPRSRCSFWFLSAVALLLLELTGPPVSNTSRRSSSLIPLPGTGWVAGSASSSSPGSFFPSAACRVVVLCL
jgi:hypothetical protein